MLDRLPVAQPRSRVGVKNASVGGVVMVQIITYPDPQKRTIAWLKQFYPTAAIRPEVPAGWAWNKLLITVADVGGRGATDVAFDEVRVTIEVSHPDQGEASRVAQQVYGLMRVWPQWENGVYFRGTVQRPTWWPDDDTRTPLYKLTLLLAFRGEQVESGT